MNTKFYIENLKERDHLADLKLKWEDAIKMDLKRNRAWK
jgi:hypothetical protein